MSQENVDLISAGFDAVNRHDFDFLRSILAPDFRYESPRTGRTYVGSDAIRDVFLEMDEVISDYQHKVEEVIDAGERVLSLVRVEGVGRASGVPTGQQLGIVWTFRDGQLVHGKAYLSHDEALEAMGLQE